jgi:hypothetical protein
MILANDFVGSVASNRVNSSVAVTVDEQVFVFGGFDKFSDERELYSARK